MQRVPRLLVLLVLAGLLISCQQPAPQAAAPKAVTTAAPKAAPTVAVAATATPKPLRPLVVQLPWRHNCESCALYNAVKGGYFEQEGLAVTFKEGGPQVPALNNVLSGEAEIGVTASLDGIVPQVAENVPIVMTGAILQEHPLGYVILEKNLTPEQRARELTPKDLIGKRVGVQSEAQLIALLHKNGVNDRDVTIVRIGGENPADLLTQSVDFASYWVVNQPLALEQQGLPWKALRYNQWGVPFYADIVFTKRSFLETPEGKQVMRAFLRGLRNGMQRMINDQDFTVKTALAFGGSETEQILRRRIQLQAPMMTSESTKSNGLLWMDGKRIEEALDFYMTNNVIRRRPTLQELMTLDYLK